MKYAVLFLVLLLPACASDRPWGGIFEGGIFGKPAGEVKEHRKIDSKQQTMEPQLPAPVEAQQPPPPPKRHEHNIEED